MSLKKLAQRRVSASTSGESLRQLSPQEVQKVAGAAYYGDQPYFPYPPNPGELPRHDPVPGPYPSPEPIFY